MFRSADVDCLADLPAQAVRVNFRADGVAGVAEIQANIEEYGFDFVEREPKVLGEAGPQVWIAKGNI